MREVFFSYVSAIYATDFIFTQLLYFYDAILIKETNN